MQNIINQKIKELELAVKHNEVEKVKFLLKEDVHLADQLVVGNTEILLILAESLNIYINFKTNYCKMLDLLAKYKINTLKINGKILENNNLLDEIIKYINEFKLKYRTLLEHVAFFLLDNNINYKQNEEIKSKVPKLLL